MSSGRAKTFPSEFQIIPKRFMWLRIKLIPIKVGIRPSPPNNRLT